jgi:hypothetical protein
MNASLRLSTSVAVSLCEARPLDVLYRVCRAAQPPSLTFGRSGGGQRLQH